MLPRLPVIPGFRAGHPRPFCSFSQAKIWIARPASQDSWSVLDTLVDQPVTLTMKPTVVLFCDTWHAHNAPNLRLTTQIRHQ
jgi:hypothetical protein